MKNSFIKWGIAGTALASLAFSSFAFAEDVSVTAGADVSVTTTGTPTPKPGVGGIRKDIRGDAMEARKAAVSAFKEDHQKILDAAKTRKAELLESLKSIRDAKKVKLQEAARLRVQGILSKIFNALENHLDRLTKVDARIAAKINEKNTAGEDTTASAALLVSAQTAFAKAKTDVEAAKTAAMDQANTTTTKEALRALVKTAEESIKAAAEAYRRVAISLKLVIAVSATPTPSTSASGTPTPTETPTATPTPSTSQ